MVDDFRLERLRELQVGYRPFQGLGSVYVPGEGADEPIAFVIGEAPGAVEVIRRRPFVGPAGIVMRMLMSRADLHATGVDANCWLTNTVKFKPPRNRTPTDREIAAAKPFLRREWIAVGKPIVIIPVGKTALKAVTGRSVSILRVAGRMWERTARDGTVTYVWPMVHPAFGLRNKAVQPLLEKDWRKLGAWLRSESLT